MSLVINVYCKEVSEELIPKIVNRLNEFDMLVEIHPKFKFDQENDSGFLPFKFSFKNTPFDILKNKNLLSGFEIYIDDFDFSNDEDLNPKLTFLEKLLGRKKNEISFSNQSINEKVKECNKIVTFVWGSSLDTFDFRFAVLTSEIITELTDGVCNYPADNIWFDNEDIIKEAFKEVIDYELSFSEEEINYQLYEKW